MLIIFITIEIDLQIPIKKPSLRVEINITKQHFRIISTKILKALKKEHLNRGTSIRKKIKDTPPQQ